MISTMTTVLLVRHGLTALTKTTLLGWTPGIPLDDQGRRQALAVADRTRAIPLAAVVSSPLDRCRETAGALCANREPPPDFHVDERLGDVRYGDWTGRVYRDLRRDPLWKIVDATPADAAFPNGESIRAMAFRAVSAIREWNERLGPEATYVVVSHADPIRAILSDALGLHLESYSRLMVLPGSLSVVRYDGRRPRVMRINDVGGDISDLLPPTKHPRRSANAGRQSRPG